MEEPQETVADIIRRVAGLPPTKEALERELKEKADRLASALRGGDLPWGPPHVLPKPRWIVAISVAGDYVTALCNDGTAWVCDQRNFEHKWRQLPAIPQ